MVSLEKITQNQKEIQKRWDRRLRQVTQIKKNETEGDIGKRERMHISWSSHFPILECEWHTDRCVYDGVRLKPINSMVLSTVLGEIDFGPSLLAYRIASTMDLGEHFEQCPKCHILYRMGPSPEDLEKLRTYRPPEFRVR